MLARSRRAPPPGRTFTALAHDANGLIIDARTWRVLAVPAGVLNAAPTASIVDEHLARGDYEVFPVDDGTVVTVYSWVAADDVRRWGIATSRGFDVSTFVWLGERTYAEVLYDLLCRYPDFVAAAQPALVPATAGGDLAAGPWRLDLPGLDDDHCYTIGFRCHDFHPLRADPERVWQIASHSLAGAAPVRDEAPAAPGLPVRAAVTPQFSSLAEARELAADSIKNASVDGPADDPDRFNYGVILRARPDRGVPPSHTSVIIGSPLLAIVRDLVYEVPRDSANCSRDSRGVDHFTLAAMRAFLSPRRAVFAGLFPELARSYAEWDARIDELTDIVVELTRRSAMKPLAAARAAAPTSSCDNLSFVAQAIHSSIEAKHAVPAFTPETPNIIRDLVRTPVYAALFCHMLA